MPTHAERVAGCLLGGAVGDALGAGVEFASRTAIRAAYGPAGVTGYVPAYGRAGAVTDDTQMVLATVDGLVRAELAGETDPVPAVWRAYRRWYAGQSGGRVRGGVLADSRLLDASRAPGNACLSGLATGRMATPAELVNAGSKGCGTTMRSAPFGLDPRRTPADAFDLAARAAALTHGHPTALSAAGATAAIVRLLLDGMTVADAATRAAAALPADDETRTALEAALRAADGRPDAAVVADLGAGWVAEEALAIAVYCAVVCGGDDVHAALLLAVDHDGDSDSTGAVTGNLLGAAYGPELLPADWRDGNEAQALCLRMGADLVAACTGGRPDRAAYPPD